jgi:putative SOS response-associated peptidase YedK
MSPKTDLEIYIRRHRATFWLPDDLAKPFVGPFDPGLFLRADVAGELLGEVGQWDLIRPSAPARKETIQPRAIAGKKPGAARPRSTNNARSETVATSPAFLAAWAEGRRCLIPASWYQEPNWETGRNVWWQLKRADRWPAMDAGWHLEPLDRPGDR